MRETKSDPNTKSGKKGKQGNRVKVTTKIWVLLLSFIIAGALYLSVAVSSKDLSNSLSFANSSEGVYVIEDLNVNYIYDKTKYEVVSLSAEPYAVVRGDKALINILKWTGKPEFYINLTDKAPGTYREVVRFKGIDKNLQVEIYPSITDLRLMEQQTVKMVPTIEVIGQDNLDDDYIVAAPDLLQQEVRIRDTQDKLNQIGSVKGVVDVSKIKETSMFDVELKVYDRNGKHIPDINLIDKVIEVRIPVEEKVTIVEEKVIEEIVVVDKNKDLESNQNSNNESPSPSTPENVKPSNPVKEGILSFINIPSNLDIKHQTTNLKWTGDVTVNLKGFKAGVYEMTVNDNGTKKVVKFSLVSKYTDVESPTPDEDTSSNDGSEPVDSNEPAEEPSSSEKDSLNQSETEEGGIKEPDSPSDSNTTQPSKSVEEEKAN